MGSKFKSDREGSCSVHPEHTWKPGDMIFWDGDKKVICSNEECYKARGGSAIVQKFAAKKKRTRVEAREESQVIWEYAMQDALQLWPPNMKGGKTSDGKELEIDVNRENRLKQARSFYFGIIQLMV
jgi:hypothetical protein